MRPEHHSNTQPRLLRKAALGDAGGGAAKRRAKVNKATGARGTAETRAGRTAQGAAAGDTGLARETRTLDTPRAARGKAQAPARESAEAPAGGRRPERRSSRFLGPAQLDEARKAAISAALADRDIGDAVGRQIFIGALEYQLSAFGAQLQRRGEPPAEEPVTPRPDEALVAIGEQARLLAERLRSLGGPSLEALTRGLTESDRLGRGYDAAYLRLLACEIDRIEEACGGAAAQSAQPEVAAEDPGPSRELVAKLASIYADCFEEEPTAEADGRFAALLAVLSEETGLVIGHDPAFLADVVGP